MNPRMLATEIEEQSSLLLLYSNNFCPTTSGTGAGVWLSRLRPMERMLFVAREFVFANVFLAGSGRGAPFQEQENDAKPSARIPFPNNSSQTRPKTREP
jgi:hypothetical protein